MLLLNNSSECDFERRPKVPQAAVSRQGGDGLVCLRFRVERSSIHNYSEATASCELACLHDNKDECLQYHEINIQRQSVST